MTTYMNKYLEKLKDEKFDEKYQEIMLILDLMDIMSKFSM